MGSPELKTENTDVKPESSWVPPSLPSVGPSFEPPWVAIKVAEINARRKASLEEASTNPMRDTANGGEEPLPPAA